MKILDVPQSGSIAGQTSSRNRFGQYRRTRAVPVNPNTPAQTDVRSTLADVSKQWKDLTTAQQDAWNYYALAHPRVDALGQPITLTGLQMYVSINTLLVTAGFTETAAAPDNTAIAAQVISVGDPSLAADIEIDFSPAPVPADTVMVVYSSPPVSPGTTFNRDYRIVRVVAAAAISPITLAVAMAAKWGTLVPGQRFFLRTKLLRTATAGKGVTSAESNVIILDLEA